LSVVRSWYVVTGFFVVGSFDFLVTPLSVCGSTSSILAVNLAAFEWAVLLGSCVSGLFSGSFFFELLRCGVRRCGDHPDCPHLGSFNMMWRNFRVWIHLCMILDLQVFLTFCDA